MPCSVARAFSSTLIIIVAGANIRGHWQRVLGSVPWAVGTVCGKALL